MIGMAVTIAFTHLLCILLNLSNASKLAVMNVMVVLALSQVHKGLTPIENGSLRFIESVMGIGVGIFFTWFVKLFIKNY